MKPQPRTPLLARLWRKLFPAPRPPQPAVQLSAQPRPLTKGRRLDERGIEPLEGRIAPAILMPNGLDVKYTDSDGDLVTIHFSKQIFVPAPGGSQDTILTSVFTFSSGKAHTGAATVADDGMQLLQKIDLTKVRPNASVTPASGVSFTITAQKTDANHDGTLEGNGFANVGAINAAGIAVGSIVVPGDLGQLDAGNSNVVVGVAALKVQSLGKLTNTQAGTANYESTIVGQLGSFTADTIEGAYLNVKSGNGVVVGKIGTLSIAHNIKPRNFAVSATNDGFVQTTGDIGTLLLGSGERHPAQVSTSDGLIGGAGASAGSIKVGGQIGKAIILGDLRGGTGASSGSIEVTGQIGSLQVAGALYGAGASSASVSAAKLGAVSIGLAGGPGLSGGSGAGSGVLTSRGAITSLTISEIVGQGANSGGVTASGAIGSVNVTGSVTGGASAHSGFIESSTGLGAVKLGGNLLGYTGAGSGVISTDGAIASFTALGAIGVRGNGINSGGVSAVGKIGSVTLSGTLKGGAGQHSGFIDSETELGPIKILGSIEGGTGVKSGTILSGGAIGAVTITGHVRGGNATTTPASGSTPASTSGGDLSGSITAGVSGFGNLASISIGDGLFGGSAIGSGVISSGQNIGIVSISRAPAAGDAPVGDAIAGGAGVSSGVVLAQGLIGQVTVRGNIHGGDGQNSGSIQEQGVLRTVTVTGSLLGGNGDGSGSILALDSGTPGGVHASGGLGTVKISASIMGGGGLRSGVVSSDGAIGTLTAGGLFAGGDATAGRVVSGAGLYGIGNVGTLTLGVVGTLSAPGGTVLAYGAVGYVNAVQIVHGAVHVADVIGSLSVAGDVSGSVVTAGGQAVFNGKTDNTIGRIAIQGNVVSSQIFAGYGVLGDAEDGHAQIGPVTVKGNWVSSSLVAGVRDSNGNGFGDAGDRIITNTTAVKSRIASVVIGGLLDAGTAVPNYGFVAQTIGSFQFGATKAGLNATPGQFFQYPGQSGGKTNVREVTV